MKQITERVFMIHVINFSHVFNVKKLPLQKKQTNFQLLY